MKSRIRLIHILSIFCALVFLSPVGAAHALSVDKMRTGLHTDTIRLVLDLSETQNFRVFVLEKPYRIVIDLPTFQWKAGQTPQDKKTGILSMRHGHLTPQISRLVLDMDKPTAIRTAFALPRSAGKPDRLVIDYEPVSAQKFQSLKGKIYGTLNTNNTNNAVYNKVPSRKTAGFTPPVPPPSRPKVQSKAPPPFKKPLIIIDPGHGGADPGSISRDKIYEKRVVLALSKELKRQLEATGRYRVLLTRHKDVYIKLRNRVKFARKHEGDLFISIHADSISKSNVRGASIYTLSEKASDKQTERLAARENKADLIAGIDLSIEDEEVANILMDLAMRDTMNQSKFFAEQLVKAFKRKSFKTLERPHRYAGFAVLKAPDIPSILIEAGFMSNYKEAHQLNSASYRKKLANVLRHGIDDYFKQVRKNQRE